MALSFCVGCESSICSVKQTRVKSCAFAALLSISWWSGFAGATVWTESASGSLRNPMFSTCSKSIQVILQNSVNICEMWCFSTIRTVVKLSLTSSQSTPANPKQQLLQTGNSEQMLYIWPQFAVSCFTEDFWFSFCLFVCFFVFF